MNTYEYNFSVVCPNDKESIQFNLSITTAETIFVEDIKTFLEGHKEAFQEDLANKLHAKFGGRQVIKAIHQDVLITTCRGSDKSIVY